MSWKDRTMWHKLTLEELLCLTSSKSLVELTKEYEKRPNRVQLFLRKQSCTGGLVDHGHAPPCASAQDDLDSYIILRWCPWFSNMFGVLSDANLNMLTLKLLRLNSEEHPISLELLSTALLVLTQPNVPFTPTCRDSSQAQTFLFHS